MHAERAIPVEVAISDRARWIGLAVSLLLHAIAAVVILLDLRFNEPIPEPVEQPIDVVFMPPPSPPPAPPLSQTLPLPPMPPPPVPQLVEAPTARESNAPLRPPVPGRQGETRQAAIPRTPIPAPQAPGLGPRAPAPVPPEEETSTMMRVGGAIAPRRPDQPAAQALKDFILAQVVQLWVIDYKAPRFSDLTLGGRVTVQPDGMLGPPFGKNDPWNPARMIRDYEYLLRRGYESERSVVETFLLALRAAQPLRLPKGGDNHYPMDVQLAFRLGDL